MVSKLLALPAVLLALSHGALASTPCTTIQKGSLGFSGEVLNLNSLNQLTQGNGTTPIRAEFQNCPDANQTASGYNYNGRIIIFAPDSVQGDCLTLVYDAANPRYYADAKPCVGEYVPEDAQFWGMGDDFGAGVIFWVGTSFCASGGAVVGQEGVLEVGPWGQLVWACDAGSTENIELVGPA